MWRERVACHKSGGGSVARVSECVGVLWRGYVGVARAREGGETRFGVAAWRYVVWRGCGRRVVSMRECGKCVDVAWRGRGRGVVREGGETQVLARGRPL